jgi:hypothetical protein
MRGIAIALLMASAPVGAELLKFKSGSALAGEVVSMDAMELRLRRCGRIEIYPRGDVESITPSTAPEDCTAKGPARILDLPRKTRMVAKLLDFVDTAHEPRGQTFRAVLLEPVVISGQTVLAKGAMLLIRLVPSGFTGQTLDIDGVQLTRDEWARFRGVGLVSPLLTQLGEVQDPRAAKDVAEPLRPQGERVYLPSRSILTFTLDVPVALDVAPQKDLTWH